MFENVTYKKKTISLFLLLALLFLTANKRSFRITRNAHKQMKEVKEQLEFMKTSSKNSEELYHQLALYDGLIGKQNIGPNVVQQSILGFATKYSDINIEELKEPHLSEANGFMVITNQLILEGNYLALSKVVYEYEKKFDVSSLVSVIFYKKKNFNKKSELRVLLTFQNYEKSI